MTVGAMADLGYTVDYNGADKYTKADLGAACQCRRRLGENEDSFEEVVTLGNHHRERKLSDEGHKTAIEQGMAFLDSFSASSPDGKDGRALESATEQYATVYVQEEGIIYAVHVQK